MPGVVTVQAIVPVRTLDRQILPPTTAEARGAGCDLLRLSVSEHKLYRTATGAECNNNNIEKIQINILLGIFMKL